MLLTLFYISQVFLKYWQSDQLSACLDYQLRGIVRIQALIRAVTARKQFLYDIRMSQQDAEEVTLLGNYIGNQGHEVYKSLVDQNEHDVNRATNSRVSHVWYILFRISLISLVRLACYYF